MFVSLTSDPILSPGQVRLMISDSDLSDDFSLDTVGSYGEVKCKGRLKDYVVSEWWIKHTKI